MLWGYLFGPLGPRLEQFKIEEELLTSYVQTLSVMQKMLDMKDELTAGHSERVTEITSAILHEMLEDPESGLYAPEREYDESELLAHERIYRILRTSETSGLDKIDVDDRTARGRACDVLLAAEFHDIGKVGVPDDVLQKPGGLTTEEFEKIMRHPGFSAEIVGMLKDLSRLIPIVEGHHERIDGRGYPHHLTGDKIPLGASVLVIADCADAIISPRVYKPGESFEDTVFELMRCSGYKNAQFNMEHMDYLIKAMAREHDDGTRGFITTYGQAEDKEETKSWSIDESTAEKLISRMKENSIPKQPERGDREHIQKDVADHFVKLLKDIFNIQEEVAG